jgi:CRP/FNR family transcriptional regulator
MASTQSKDAFDILSLLRSMPIFNDIPDRDLADFLSRASKQHFKRGTSILTEGDPPNWLYVVLSGRVKVSKPSPVGKPITLAYFIPGEMVGELAVFENIPYPASAEAVAATELLSINRTEFLSFLARHPAAAQALLKILGNRLRLSQDRLRGFAGERADQRLAGALTTLFEKMGAYLTFSRQDIADMAGTTLETAIRVLSRLTKDGIIRSSRGRITIVDINRLRMLSQGLPNLPAV